MKKFFTKVSGHLIGLVKILVVMLFLILIFTAIPFILIAFHFSKDKEAFKQKLNKISLMLKAENEAQEAAKAKEPIISDEKDAFNKEH